jgi:hypothetical protein
MKRRNPMNTCLKPAAAAVALALAAGPAGAVTYTLCAGPITKTFPGVPDPVPMWGYALDDNLADGCGDPLTNPITVPGPRLTVPPGDPTLVVNLLNGLSEPTSLVIPGLKMPTPLGPTWNDGATGARTSASQRVRSFGVEAAPGGMQTYTFAVERPGTFLYHSGTLPQKQVYMGLYGAATKDEAPGVAYPGVGGGDPVAYDNELVLFYSDVDPAFNAAVEAGTLQTAIDYQARVFLINGEPYQAGMADITAGTAGDLAATTSVLVRFLSAASETHVPVLQGMHMTLHAEDGLPYTWQDGVTVGGAAPRSQYSVMLPPLKTADATLVASAAGRHAVYDGNGYMTNPSDITDFTVGDTVGGMLRFVSFGEAPPPNSPPVVDPVADQVNQDGDVIAGLQVVASDPDVGDVLTYAATGLPPDLVIDSGTGLVTGTIAANASAGSPYAVTVDVSDGTDTTPVNFQWTVNPAVPQTLLYFSIVGNSNPPGVTGDAADGDANIFAWDGTSFSRVVDMSTLGVPLGANVDGLVMVDETHFYVSFTGNITLPGIGQVQDEDVAYYDGTTGTWSVYFDGTALGLTAVQQDIDAFDIVGGVLYFSIVGNSNPPGVTGDPDDANIFSWNGAAFSRVVDITAVGVPAGANVDGLRVVDANHFYVSFTGNITLPGIGQVQDEDVVEYNNGAWSVYFDGTALGLTAVQQDIDAMSVPLP